MKLLIDMGNSRVKWAWFECGQMLDPGAVTHGSGRLPAIVDLIDASGHRPDDILVASVAAIAETQVLVDAMTARYGAAVRTAQTHAEGHGVRNAYIEPRQLGVDRWLAMVAAFARYHRPLCVVSAGTAVTIDALTGDGRHLGGLIVPGPALMRGALLRETGGISAAADLLDRPAGEARDWGRDTESCMKLGSHRAIACLVENCAKALPEPRGLVVVTGGDGPALIPELSVPADYRPLLVLEGLAVSFGEMPD